MNNSRMSLRFVDHQIIGDHVEYRIEFKDGAHNTWQINARYRRLRQIHDELTKIYNQLPDFPNKRWFGNLDSTFISQRKAALENYFNNLLKKFSYDQLQPLKDFVEEGNRSQSVIMQPERPVEQPQPVVINRPQPVVKQPVMDEPPSALAIEKIVDNYRDKFFHLNEPNSPPEIDEVRRKKAIYEKNLKFDTSLFNPIFKLPNGSQTNLISIQDETLLGDHCPLLSEIDKVLDDIDLDIKHLQLNVNEIIVNLS